MDYAYIHGRQTMKMRFITEQ